MVAAWSSMVLRSVPVRMDLVGNQCLGAVVRGKKFHFPRTVSVSEDKQFMNNLSPTDR